MDGIVSGLESFADSQAPWLMLFVAFLGAMMWMSWKSKILDAETQKEVRESDKAAHMMRQAKLDEIHSEIRADAIRERTLLLGIIQEQSKTLDKISETQIVIQDALKEIQYDTKKLRMRKESD
ncbi:hypothetical protein [Fictibacillus sp. NRS-1165]|uniref:hypothetical protein n=1 Tax=Fictibacillus sp. NRS-1165 TaxID=3144463 RepID=UPI003D1B9539